LQVPDDYYQIYKDLDPRKGFDPSLPFPDMTEKDMEDARRVYAMVSNIDDNIGRVMSRLEDLGIEENTIVIFMTDNGPQQRRYVAGMKGRKSDVYRGGVRVPLFVQYPGLENQVDQIETTAAHIDLLPTLAAISGAAVPPDRHIDGKNLLPLMTGGKVAWEDRPLFFNWTRKYPEMYRNVALQQGPYKLVGNTDYNSDINQFELYHIQDDPYELKNIVEENQEIARSLKAEMDRIFLELTESENLKNPPLIRVGSAHENPVVLNRNDAKGQRGIWAQDQLYGYWDVAVDEGDYDIRMKFIKPLEETGYVVLESGTMVHRMKIDQAGSDIIEMNNVHLPSLKGSLRPFFDSKSGDIFPFWVELKRN
jgi:arylsulfatase